ncbi:MAG: SpoIIE family protein phosphatase [Tissierella sp.]|nr:SpoIIE family protein phosphatase [Tissierella sp.]
MEHTKIKLFDRFKKYNRIIFVFILSIILYFLAAIHNEFFMNIMSVTSYLSWHIIFEFASILVSFSIFAVTYFIYEESGSLKMMILGCAFLIMGFLDGFHALSFKGMTDFFIANDTANRATTLWILSRLIGSLGFMSAILTPSNIISNIKKGFLALITISFSILLFLIVTYLPDFFPAMFIEELGLTNLKLILEYIIILLMGISFVIVAAEYNKTNSNREYLFMIALMLSILSEFAFTNYGSVYDAFNYIGHLYKVFAYFTFYKAIYIENVSVPYREMKKARHELKNHLDNLNLIVEERTKKLEEMNKVLMTDIENAKEMQRYLLPTEMPKDESVSFYAEYFAAERLSGDFYNVVKLDENNIAIYIGDVSGHGVSAAMLTVFANQSIKPFIDEENVVLSKKIVEPGFVLKNIYKSFNNTNYKIDTYILMLYGIYNVKDKSFTYASAGINVTPYIIKKSGEILELNIKGFPICKLGEFNMPFYDNRIIQLEAGDKILFYTDGLIEAKNKSGEIFGKNKMKEFLSKNQSLSPNELYLAIKNSLFNHIGNHEKLMDDVTYLIMEVRS